MGRPAKLTRKMLEHYGITEITTDGRVFMGEHQLNPHITSKPSRYEVQKYRTITVYSPEEYQRQKNLHKTATGCKTFVLSRVMWAWFHTECPADWDVDHINNNSLDDRLSNYQLLTRQENLAKRKGYRNQYIKSYRGE